MPEENKNWGSIAIASIRTVPKRFWILSAVILVGLFLRTYHFHDWLLFNPDQARDANVVSSVISGDSSGLILGPEAGNTRFDLGPWFYHMEIISAKLFGSSPDAMAYPDLLFSILSIPLFYFFLKKYFPTNLSLALTGLYSASFFMVRYSRFAWNPNSIPFFVLLFLLGILYLMGSDRKKSFWGAALIGIGIGVGMQLHILLFFMLSCVAAIFFLFLFFRKSPILPKFGKIGITLALILIANIGQIAYEMNHGISNTRKFLKSTTGTTVEVKPGENLKLDLYCLAQANWHIISSAGDINECNTEEILAKYFKDKRVFLVYPENKKSLYTIAIGAIFSLSGFFLLAYFWRKERNQQRKDFLALAEIYGLVTLIAVFPVIGQAEIRYYVVSFFLPFVFLGILADGFLRFGKIWPKVIATVFFAWLFFLNGSTEAKTAETFLAGKANNENFIFLGETEKIADFLMNHSSGSKRIYFRGEKKYEKRYFKPLNYILTRRGIDLARPKSDEGELDPEAQIYFVVKTRYGKYAIGDKIGGYRRVAEIVKFNDVSIIVTNADNSD